MTRWGAGWSEWPRAGLKPALTQLLVHIVPVGDGAGDGAGAGDDGGLKAARAAFYEGEIAQIIAAHSKEYAGLVTADDLATFHCQIEEPATLSYHGYDVYKCGLWSQGPVFLQQLALLEGFDLNNMGHNSADYIHTVTEAAKLAFADREQLWQTGTRPVDAI